MSWWDARGGGGQGHEMEMKRQKELPIRRRGHECGRWGVWRRWQIKIQFGQGAQARRIAERQQRVEKENPVSEGGYNFNVAHIHNGLLFF